MKCSFIRTAKGSQCIRCGYELQRDYDRAPTRMCKPGAAYIIDHNIHGTETHEQPDHRCGQKECKHKQDAKGTVKVECCSGVEKELNAYACTIHGRCLPGFVRHEKAIAKWNDRKPESDIYHLCCICTDREE
jgi:hypothetical protein